MLKYIGGTCAIALLTGAIFVASGCASSKSEFVVGKDIAVKEVQEFYYTIDASTDPPEFQRYCFRNKGGKYEFYHEKREGNTWPLREKHITVAGTIELSDAQWMEFADCIKDGKVTKRKESANAGGRGPWLFLYWPKDEGKYQVFAFADNGRQQNFEKLCVRLKTSK